jgi:acyl-CoA reductase-like NAD-dependent aldehyde dehydrogenase
MSTAYRDFHLQPIAGEWREGASERTARVTNPYDGSALLAIRLATAADLDAAFLAAEKAQAPGRRPRLPSAAPCCSGSWRSSMPARRRSSTG